MRHGKSGRQFGRNTSHRRAMLRALTANLVAHERIETTDAKAKELRRVAERLITRAIRLGETAYTPNDKLTVADRARRQAAQQQVGTYLRRFQVTESGGESQKVDLIEKVFVDLAKRFKSRPGGYTRIIKLGRRRGDNAPMSVIEFVEKGEPRGATQPKTATEKAPKAKKAEKAEAKAEKKPRAKKAAKAAAAG
ncbi:MAG TPA: 50S ribosomal protein L17 [Polyangiaceae bacterium]|jgi:large subunit ribosomal protein L17|nr:50S ribosomal protein L17 [Polyangiaceae bacterium]